MLLYRSCGICCEVYLWKTTWTLWRTCILTVLDTRSCPNLRLSRIFRSNPILRLIRRREKSTWLGSKSTLSRTGVLKQGQGRVWSRRSRLSRPGIRGNTRTLAPRMRTRRNLNVIMNWLQTGIRDIKFLRPEQDLKIFRANPAIFFFLRFLPLEMFQSLIMLYTCSMLFVFVLVSCLQTQNPGRTGGGRGCGGLRPSDYYWSEELYWRAEQKPDGQHYKPTGSSTTTRGMKMIYKWGGG